MGLFKSSPKLAQPPLPNLAIHLYNPTDKVFKPDDVVTGHISLAPIIPITPYALEVSLFGQSLIWLRTSHRKNSNSMMDYYHWRDNAPLFEVSENVLPSPSKKEESMTVYQPGQTYTFPFHFRFPAGTRNSRLGQYKQDSDERWTVTPHDLPPTFLHTDKLGDATEPDYAKIEYGVRVKLICPGIGVVQGQNLIDLTTTAPVLFQPMNRNPQHILDGPISVLRYPKTFTFQSSILTGQQPSQIGFRQAMHDRFSSTTPKVDFEAALDMPDVLASGSEFRFRASFHVLSKTDSVSHIPPIQFRVLKLDLLDFTFVRAPRDEDASTFRDGHHRSNKYDFMPPPDAPFGKYGRENEDYSERKTHLNCLPDSAAVELEEVPSYDEKKKGLEQAKSCEVWFTARVPGFTPPNFKSFAITRAYRVKVKLGVEVGGKQFVLEAESHVREMGSVPA
ncbi:uncharacterized protein K460DRAFT_365256 [Cucurbitaria berberidis CBS 394.84]|uniref:Arrestin-like N-terminal domain-containing protein n=1 Tax=Cucurbitaria berberidis CBS 394.84 TaxID=1168544 RepID=A0A9P4GQA6_9PLEO|nr:uncharacterized protein K460DRAFT_365256 [Cucurbitaria berberidis CBS 394.84]KAF1849372.1 hypothetical protein K460DRAFT_365256 [Cucurbitaria berberidis CBS 394.84]